MALDGRLFVIGRLADENAGISWVLLGIRFGTRPLVRGLAVGTVRNGTDVEPCPNFQFAILNLQFAIN